MSVYRRMHRAMSWCLWLVVGASMASILAALAGAPGGPLAAIVRDGAIIMLCTLCYGQERALYARRSNLERWGEALDKRAAALDAQAEDADRLVAHLDEWQAELMRISGGSREDRR